MNVTRYERIGLGAVLVLFVAAVIAVQFSNSWTNFTAFNSGGSDQTAAVGTQYVDGGQAALESAVTQAVGAGGVEELIINEVERGSGAPAREGDTVRVHYVGTLPSGELFDSSRDRGEPFTFTIGAGRVIEGWEEGVVGMREGGTRILVIPPELAYGSQSFGSIPANATLVFAIELLEVE